jgi:3-isopropylmalate/(R)-2-methylmalate dehydratase small subunit
VRGEGFAYRFEIDQFSRDCLLNGIDDIALIERQVPDIEEYESRRVAWMPAVK